MREATDAAASPPKALVEPSSSSQLLDAGRKMVASGSDNASLERRRAALPNPPWAELAVEQPQRSDHARLFFGNVTEWGPKAQGFCRGVGQQFEVLADATAEALGLGAPLGDVAEEEPRVVGALLLFDRRLGPPRVRR